MKQLLLLLMILPAVLVAQIASDNFNRADETPLTTSGNWQRILTNNSAGNGTVNLAGNQVVAAGAEAVYHWQGAGTFDSTSQFARATVVQASGQVGLVLLGATGQALITTWSGGTVAFYWYSGGLYQGNLATASSTVQSGDIIEAVLNGGTVYAMVNGTIITSVANTTTLLSGTPGFETYQTGAILDNWEAGSPVTYTISGTVTKGGIGLSGVLVTTRGVFSGSATSNISGAYEIIGVPAGVTTVIVTPTLTGHTMTPLTRTVAGPITANVSGQDFAAVVNIASDDFNRADETPLTTGGNWQRILTNNSAGNGTVNLTGNHVVAAGAEAVYHWQGAGTFDNDRQFARATVIQSSGQVGLALLGATGQALIATWSGGTMAVYWYSGGLYQGNLASTSSTLQAGDIIEAALNNDTVYVKVNGSIITSLVNTTTLSSGRPGFETYLTSAILDNWEAGTTASFTHTIQSSAGGGGSISPSGAVSVVHGDNQAFTITRNSGYHIADVLVDSVSVGPVGSYTFNIVTSDHAITANFAINQYTIATTATNGAIAKNPNQATYDSNTVVQLTAVPNTGYHFVNWIGDATGSTNPVSVTMNANKNITANFAINQYSIAITATNGTVTKNPDQAVYDSNTVVQLTAVPNTGYHFVNWSGDTAGSTNPVSVTMNANKNITANFAINQYSIAITAANGTVTKNPDQATYDSNTVVQLTAVPNTGYHFVNWIGDATGSTNPVSVTMNANKNITANFAINQYSIAITATNGTVTKNPDQTVYDSNTVVQLTAVPNTGYHFVNWSGDTTGSTNPVSVTMNANKNITANFAINQYSIAITAANGTVTKNPDQATYDSNTVVQLTAVPNTGYHFVNWSGDVTGSTNPVSVTMNVNKNITANFAINQYSIAITATNGAVTKNPDQAVYDSNTVVQLTAVPNTGYHFVNWSGDTAGSTNPVSVTMNVNKNITANFAINQYSIAITATNGAVTKNPDQTVYDSNTVVQLTAVPNTGYHFVNWSGDTTGSTNPVSVTMNANKNITANFAINQYSIAITAANGTVTKNPDQSAYDSNTVAQLTAVPDTGYHFLNWSGDATGSTNPVSVTMNGNKNITANFAINQYSITTTTGSNGLIVPSGTITVTHGIDTAFTITANSGYQVDSVFVDSTFIGAVTGYTFLNVTANHTIRAVFRTSVVTVNVPIVFDWNMISNPVTTANDSVRQLYIDAAFAFAYGFNPGAGYVQSYRMANGAGYWQKFPSAGIQSITGLPRTHDSINVAAGWNMVGTISSAVDTGTIVSVPEGLRASIWYGYGATGYSAATHLQPGQGYWVKSNGAGKFVLDASLLAKPSRAQASGIEVLNMMTITDSRGRSQSLYFGADARNEIPVALYRMPPSPPVGAFDVRFSTAEGGSMVRTHALKQSDVLEFPVTIQSDAYPLTVTWNANKGIAFYELADGTGGRAFQSRQMNGEGILKIASEEVNKLTVRLIDDSRLPKEYSLSQNYPNPFNPSTTITYDLPKDSRVSLKVFNIIGEELATLVSEDQKAGYKSVNWNAASIASGIYFYRLDAGGFTSVKKLILIK